MNWLPYPDAQRPNKQGPIEMAEIRSRNGYLGCCCIVRTDDEFYLYAFGETGRSWPAPNDKFNKIEDAKTLAEATWKTP